MLRTAIAILALTLFAGVAYAVDDATSENDAIQLDQNTQPYDAGSSMEKAPSTAPDPAEQTEMNESGIINE